MKLTFKIHSHHEPAAGIEFYGDTIKIEIVSGDPGGENGEFSEHIRQSLAEWFDTKVELIENEYGCYCDLTPGEEPDGCVIDDGDYDGCIYARSVIKKEQCIYWREIK